MVKEGLMRLKSKHIFALILFLFIASVSHSAQQRQMTPVYLDKLSDDLYQILGGRGANGGVYIGGDSVLLIDAKMTEESVRETFRGYYCCIFLKILHAV